MKSSTLLVLFGIVGMSGFACSPAPVAPSGSPSGPSGASCNGLSSFLYNVHVLKLPFDPGNPTPGSAPPIDSNASLPSNSPIVADLGTAFCNAPQFQSKLSAITGIYIDPTAASNGAPLGRSWGYRDQRDGKMYVGLSATLWAGGQTAPVFSAYQTALISALIPWPNMTPVPSFGTQYPDDGTDSSWMTVLSVLAHEVGHIQWYVVNVPTPGGAYDFTKLNNCTGGSFFLNWSDQSDMALEPYGRFRGFRDRHNQKGAKQDHQNPPTLDQIDFALKLPNAIILQHLGPLIDGIYGKGSPWASYFGSLTPDEDFVETFAFNVLVNATPPLRSSQITIPYGNSGTSNSVEDIPNDYFYNKTNRTELIRKLNCVAGL